MARMCRSWEENAAQFNLHRPILENVQLIASHLRGSNLIGLHVCLSSYLFRHSNPRNAELIRNSLPLYLDAFGQLGRVMEPSVTINQMSGRLNEIELWMKSTSNSAKAMAMAVEWGRYYEEWVENLKRESRERGGRML
ncbi:hypothetical protein ACJ73_10294 [Blastomyces percursus]|uniref:Uncharacterized protein n=1 Tax=Blastomyces percursus TaxID=1658174 RepID=A0A1J9PZN4_9EURO|nr:hypothetical protein ACJ73_10294 [Blastomyces percursus]